MSVRYDEKRGEIKKRHSRCSLLFFAEVVTGVHAEAASATAEAVALGAVLARVAHLAEELSLVLGAVGGVQQLVAQTCNKSCKSNKRNLDVECIFIISDET